MTDPTPFIPTLYAEARGCDGARFDEIELEDLWFPCFSRLHTFDPGALGTWEVGDE